MNLISFLGPMIGIVGIGVSITLWLKGRNRKDLSYDIISATSLVMHHDEIGKKIKIMFEDKEIKENVSLVLLRIVNTGNVPVVLEDFTQNMIIETTDGAILIAEVKETNPENLNVELFNGYVNAIEVAPLLLNSKDEIIIKLLVKSSNGRQFRKEDLKVRARIVGISDISKVKTKISRRDLFTLTFLLQGFLLSLFIAFYIILEKSLQSEILITAVSLMCGILGGMSSQAFFRMLQFNKK